MKPLSPLSFLFTSLAAILPLAASAQTTFFSDTFNNGSTISSPTPVKPTANSTSYEQVSAKTWSPNPSVSPNDLRFGIASTGSGVTEIQALFATNPVPLTQVGDYIQVAITYTNLSGILTTGGGFLGFGLYNSGQVFPMTGMTNSLTSSSNNATTGGAQNWQGYVGQISYTGGKSQIMTRAAQTTGTDNRNQDLVTSGSSSQSYGNPSATTVGSSVTSALILSAPATYTEVLNITLIGTSSLAITNFFYSGTDTNSAPLTQFGGIATNATYLTAGFDALAMGWYQKASGASNTVDISSIQITGQSTPVTTSPTITSQPVAVSVPSGAACDFNVSATGFGLSYQWHRHGTNLVDGGNISGATSSMLIISPATAADVESGANGYYVTVTGTGNLTTTSVTNSLSLVAAKNLEWTAVNSSIWDLNTTPNWQLSGTTTSATFNFGDNVTFDDLAAGTVDLSGSFLSAGSVTVNSQFTYTFKSTDGTGHFAGPGKLLYDGSGQLTLNVANTYTGGTVISNANAHVYLQNYGGLGTGPVTLALAGGQIETVNAGSSTVGFSSDFIVNDDFTINVDGSGSFGTVFFGDFSGIPGKTLTVNANSGNTTRVRAYGENTVYNANLNLAASQILWAPYSATGSQTYNGVISGGGALMQKGVVAYFNGQNTYSGGMNISAGAIGLGVDSVGSPDSVTSGPIGTGPLLLTIDSTTSTTGNGEVFAVGGARTIGNSIQYPSGTNNLTMTVGGTNSLTFSGTFSLNGNDFTSSSSIISRLIQVTNTAGTTFAGVIKDNSGTGYGITKTGPGALYLNAANTYTGSTTNNSNTTNAPGLLAGSGSIAGPVFVQTNSSIGGGSAASIGTLTINNSLAIAGNGWFRLNKSLGQQSDEVSVSGSLANTGTGTITVTNLGPALIVGDKFTLFSQPVANGAAMNITGSGMIWTNKLAVDGSIQALSVAPTTANYPTNVTFHFSNGNTLTIGWPATHLGWILQQQTNSLNVGLKAPTNAWFDVAGTSSGTNATITVNPANPTVFFRLRHP
jgi:autotransporter-associated beta strand protein